MAQRTLSREAQARDHVGCRCDERNVVCTHYDKIRTAMTSSFPSKRLKKRNLRMAKRTENAPKGDRFRMPGSQNPRKVGR